MSGSAKYRPCCWPVKTQAWRGVSGSSTQQSSLYGDWVWLQRGPFSTFSQYCQHRVNPGNPAVCTRGATCMSMANHRCTTHSLAGSETICTPGGSYRPPKQERDTACTASQLIKSSDTALPARVLQCVLSFTSICYWKIYEGSDLRRQVNKLTQDINDRSCP